MTSPPNRLQSLILSKHENQTSKDMIVPSASQLQATLGTLVSRTHPKYQTWQSWCLQPRQSRAPEFYRFTGHDISANKLSMLTDSHISVLLYMQKISFYDEGSWKLIWAKLFLIPTAVPS